MKNIKIVSIYDDNPVLFEGEFESFSDCLQEAINQEVDLVGADCRNQVISIQVKDATLEDVDFTGSCLDKASFHIHM